MKTGQTEAKIIQVQPHETPDQTFSKQVLLPNGTLIWFPIGFLTIWVITILIYLSTLRAKRVRTQPKFDLLHAQKIPCRYCKFYTNNPFLKCAVHPTTVMTKQAITCSDYQGRYLQIEK